MESVLRQLFHHIIASQKGEAVNIRALVDEVGLLMMREKVVGFRVSLLGGSVH